MNFTTKVSTCAPPLVFVLVASWLRACCYDHCLMIVFEITKETKDKK